MDVAQKKSSMLLPMLAIVCMFFCLASPFGAMVMVLPVLLPFGSGDTSNSSGGGTEGLPSGPVPTYVPVQIQYVDRTSSYAAVIAWLAARNSALADTAHMQAIEEAGKKWNVDPLLLLAITGQEQNFVPKRGNWQGPEANPWNVFHSWMEWHKGFAPAAMWAANTVARLSRGCPEGQSVIQWINGFNSAGVRANPGWGYAGDSKWWVGVSKFYAQLQGVAGTKN